MLEEWKGRWVDKAIPEILPDLGCFQTPRQASVFVLAFWSPIRTTSHWCVLSNLSLFILVIFQLKLCTSWFMVSGTSFSYPLEVSEPDYTLPNEMGESWRAKV